MVQMKRSSGFTLIELLVVIAIIAILAAILFPVFAKARQKAQQSTCLSNVKELTLSALMYCSDYDEKEPFPYVAAPYFSPAQSWGGPTGGPGNAGGAINPYVKNQSIWLCPSDPKAPTGSATYVNGATSYCMNFGYAGFTFAGASSPNQGNVPIDRYSYPAQKMWIADCNLGNAAAFYLGNGAAVCNTYVGSWHNNGANMSFEDGHATWMAQAAVPLGVWPLPFVDPVACAFWTGMDPPGSQ
jgi:prepilin-type N-terminal cleavage/methylation domain-containing protein/prepilin-type processing-associated H-X9-DG protein